MNSQNSEIQKDDTIKKGESDWHLSLTNKVRLQGPVKRKIKESTIFLTHLFLKIMSKIL